MNLSNWAVVSYKDDTGLGRMAADLINVLGLGHQLVVPSQRLTGHELKPDFDISLPFDLPDEEVCSRLKSLQGIIVLERPFHPRLLRLAKELDLKTVCIPMWEWFVGNDEVWRDCDLFVCPSQIAEKTVASFGWRNLKRIPVAMDLLRFPHRRVTGPARLFVHNAGLIDSDDRKATRDTITAFKQVRRPDIRLVVRLQKESELPQLDSRIEVRIGNLEDPSELYLSGDVAVQPSKMEGAGLMVIEPLCAGMPVITLDYPPMNEYILSKELLVRKRWFKRKAFACQWARQAHLRLPDITDLAAKIAWCAENDMQPISCENRSLAEKIFSPESLKHQWVEVLAQL